MFDVTVYIDNIETEMHLYIFEWYISCICILPWHLCQVYIHTVCVLMVCSRHSH